MSDLFTSFSNKVNTLSAAPSKPASTGGFFGGNGNNVKTQQKSSFWGSIFSTDTSKTPQGKDVVLPNVIKVQDATNASASQILTGNVSETNYKVSQGGGRTFLLRIGTNVMDIIHNA